MPPIEIVPTVPGEDIRVSATSFMAYRQCPQRASARFQGHYGAPSVVAFTGNVAHQIFKRHLAVGPIGDAEFVEACRQEVGRSHNLNSTMAELGLRPRMIEGVFEQVRVLYETFVRIPQEGFVGAEVIFELGTAPGVSLVGQVDAVFEDESGVRLVDWKTGELGEAAGQLMFYALLWTLDRGFIPATVEAVSVRTGERYSAGPTESDLVELAGEVAGMVDDLRRAWATGADLARQGGPWCEYCPILADCPEGRATMTMLDS